MKIIFSEFETEEGGERRLLIVKGPCATVNASVVRVKAALPVFRVGFKASCVVVRARVTGSEGHSLLGGPRAVIQAIIVGDQAVCFHFWVFKAFLITVNTRFAGSHAESLVLVGAAANAGVVGGKARLPVHGIIRNASLIVSGACIARGQRDSVLIPVASHLAITIVVLTNLPVFIPVHVTLGEGIRARKARGKGHTLGPESAPGYASVIGVQA